MQMQSHPVHENAVICTILRIYKGGLPHPNVAEASVLGQFRSRELLPVDDTNMKTKAAADFDVRVSDRAQRQSLPVTHVFFG
jgi:hypothetical protein